MMNESLTKLQKYVRILWIQVLQSLHYIDLIFNMELTLVNSKSKIFLTIELQFLYIKPF